MDELWTLAKDLVEGELEFLFPSMTLEWVESVETTPLLGVGVLRSDKNSALYLRMEPTNLSYGIKWPWPDSKSGERYPAERYVCAVSTDHNGAIWRSSKFPLEGNAIRISFQLRDKQSLASVTKNHSSPEREESTIRLIMRRPPGLRFIRPTSFETKSSDGSYEKGFKRDHEVLTIAGAALRVRLLDENWIEIRGSSKTPFSEAWVKALATSLEFVSGYRCDPPAFEIVSGGQASLTFWHGPFSHFKTNLLGPAGFLDSRSTNCFWRYTERLAEYLLLHPEHADRMAVQFRLIREGSNSALQTAALAITVAIESLADMIIPESKAERFPEDVLASVRTAVAGVTMTSKERDRVSGTVSLLSDVRAADRLFAWSKLADCPESLVKDWRRLRNDAAHGEDLEADLKSWDRYLASMELLYRLVGWAIGYSGHIVAASVYGHPPLEIGGSPKSVAEGS